MEKLFVCPKCRSENVRVYLRDGTILKSLRNKLTLDPSNESDLANLDLITPVTRCLECKFEFSPKCLEPSDIVLP